MKLFPARARPGVLDRSTAWGCLTSNLALPGSGSLLAGRVIGYFQIVVALLGLAVTFIFGLHFLVWSVTHWSQMHDETADPLDRLRDLWLGVRWALLGMGVFAASWLWALISSLGILRGAVRSRSPSPPPVTG